MSESSKKSLRIPVIAYVLIVLGTTVAASAWHSLGIALVCATAVALGFIWVLVVYVRRQRASEGVERHIGAESAAFAFYTVLVGLGTYTQFEAFANAPRPSTFVIFMFATFAWSIWWYAVKRRVV
jgi:hypothetical protein